MVCCPDSFAFSFAASHSPAYAEFLSLFGVDLSNLKFAPTKPSDRPKMETPDDATCTAASCLPSEAEDSMTQSMSVNPLKSSSGHCEEQDDEFSPRLTCTPLYVSLVRCFIYLLFIIIVLLSGFYFFISGSRFHFEKRLLFFFFFFFFFSSFLFFHVCSVSHSVVKRWTTSRLRMGTRSQ
jgi:hypothetical protein